jgi:hypothetical protein
MGSSRAVKRVLAFVLPAIVAIEVLWLGSLDYVLQRYGAFALAGVLVGALAAMVAVLDATPLGERVRER